MNDKQNRRTFLRASGVAVAVPLLEHASFAAPKRRREPQRLIVISNNLGVLPDDFFPNSAGKKYKLSPYLKHLAGFRDKFTVFSGLSHPACEGGHSTENCFLTGAKHPTGSGFRNTISLDQYAAERLGRQTRFSTLNLGVNIVKYKRSLAWSRDGVLLPAEDSPARLFRRMFLQGSKSQKAQRVHQLRRQESILDAIAGPTKSLARKLGKTDREQLSLYLSSIRDLESRLHDSGQWERRPRPKTDQSQPQDITDRTRIFDKCDQLLAMAALAIQSDSTRIITMMVDAFETPAFHFDGSKQKTSFGYHSLSHHGKRKKYVDELRKTDQRQMKMVGTLLGRLRDVKLAGRPLIDYTMVLYGSNMGDANTHTNTNLPVLLAGGRFRHGQHLAYDTDNNKPLCNLYVNLLQALGVQADQFGSSTGTLAGI